MNLVLGEQSLTLATWMLVFTGIGAICFARQQIKQAEHLKRVENLQELMSWFDGGIYLRIRRQLAIDRLKQLRNGHELTGENAPSQAYRVLDFFEHVGWLAEKHYVDEDDIWCGFYDSLIHSYADLRVLIDDERRVQNDDSIYQSLEGLLEKLKEQQGSQGNKPTLPDARLIQRYYESESQLPIDRADI